MYTGQLCVCVCMGMCRQALFANICLLNDLVWFQTLDVVSICHVIHVTA